MKQPDGRKTIEGYWQDTARRILFARGASPGYAYGTFAETSFFTAFTPIG